DAGDMRVALETGTLDQSEDALHLALVVNVLGENVLVQGIPSRAVNEEHAVLFELTRPFREELPAFFLEFAALVGGFKLFAGPEDGLLGGQVETFGIEHGALVVIAQEDHLAFHDQIDAFARIRSVAHDVAETVDRSEEHTLNS